MSRWNVGMSERSIVKSVGAWGRLGASVGMSGGKVWMSGRSVVMSGGSIWMRGGRSMGGGSL
jgi:hypothetical protein